MWSFGQILTHRLLIYLLSFIAYIEAGYHYPQPVHYYNQPLLQPGQNYAPLNSYTGTTGDYQRNLNHNLQAHNYLQYNVPSHNGLNVQDSNVHYNVGSQSQVINHYNPTHHSSNYNEPHYYNSQLHYNNFGSPQQQYTPNHYNPTQQSLNYNNAQTHYQTETLNSIENNYNTRQPQEVINTINNVEQAPAIKKHIYFHVPPPDLEAQNIYVPAIPPKKSYKIIFIKVPSQESKSRVYLQNQLNNLNSNVEEKTLIYVLVKKPEVSETVVQTKTISSNPEVFYVKYKQTPHELDDIAHEVNYELGDHDVTEEDQEVLQPGLINGQT